MNLPLSMHFATNLFLREVAISDRNEFFGYVNIAEGLQVVNIPLYLLPLIRHILFCFRPSVVFAGGGGVRGVLFCYSVATQTY